MPAQRNPHVTVTGIGAHLPERVVDNDELSSLVSGFDSSKSGDFGTWVDQVTHVHERRFSTPEERTVDLSLKAARKALKTAGLEPQDLDLIIYATFTESQAIPGDHCMFADQLGAERVPVFQLKAACAGSIYGMANAWSHLAAGLYDNILVIGTETASKALNFHDPITSIIFGDGAGAVVMSRSAEPLENGGMYPPFLDFKYSPRNIHLANSNIPIDVARFPDREIEPGVQLVEQALVEMESGPNVLRSAVLNMTECLTRCLGYDPKSIRRGEEGILKLLENARVVPHQANGRILDGLADRLKLPRDRLVRTIYRTGNISAASNLIALDFGLRHGNMGRVLDEDGRVTQIVTQPEHRIQEGELVLLPSIGGGYLMGCIGFVAEPALLERIRAEETQEAASV
ncbi:MAG: ketoacyl-ACP synthase III [Planctomycetota bacterium]|nr:ketoacyl-ACP synthase III [Planctomycetota bacterium]